jgi:hypothetical protein
MRDHTVQRNAVNYMHEKQISTQLRVDLNQPSQPPPRTISTRRKQAPTSDEIAAQEDRIRQAWAKIVVQQERSEALMAETNAPSKTIVDRVKSYVENVEPLVQAGIIECLLSKKEFCYKRESHQLPWPVWVANSHLRIEYDYAIDHLYTRKKSCEKDFKHKTFSEIFYGKCYLYSKFVPLSPGP